MTTSPWKRRPTPPRKRPTTAPSFPLCALCPVIHLYYYEGYSINEIAGLLALPAPTVGTRLSRGRKRLGEILKEEEML